jgi:hypothetical protein
MQCATSLVVISTDTLEPEVFVVGSVIQIALRLGDTECRGIF